MICSTNESTALVVRDYTMTYETTNGRRRKSAAPYVALPTRHDGKYYRRLTRMEHGAEIFGAWCLILTVAARCPRRGVLVDERGEAISAQDLSDMTGFPVEIFEMAIEALLDERIGWLERVPMSTIEEWNSQDTHPTGGKTGNEVAKINPPKSANSRPAVAAPGHADHAKHTNQVPNMPGQRERNSPTPSGGSVDLMDEPLGSSENDDERRRLLSIENYLIDLQMIDRVPPELYQSKHITRELIQKICHKILDDKNSAAPVNQLIKELQAESCRVG